MTTRRGFLGAILAAAAAPAIVKVSNLMPIYVPKIVPLTLFGDGKADDTAALQALLDGLPVMYAGKEFRAADGALMLPQATFKISSALTIGQAIPRIFGGGSTLQLTETTDTALQMHQRSVGVTLENIRVVSHDYIASQQDFAPGEALRDWLKWERTKQTAYGAYYGEIA